MMRRNLDSRVEVHAPVENPALRQELRRILDVQFADTRSAWDMDSEGNYTQRTPVDENARGAQDTLMGVAERRLAAAAQHKEKKVRRSFCPSSQSCSIREIASAARCLYRCRESDRLQFRCCT